MTISFSHSNRTYLKTGGEMAITRIIYKTGKGKKVYEVLHYFTLSV